MVDQVPSNFLGKDTNHLNVLISELALMCCTGKSSTKQNGWWAFYKDANKYKVQRAGETKKECQTRVWKECLSQWKQPGPAGETLRRKWSLCARELNTMAPYQSLAHTVADNNDDDSKTTDDLVNIYPYLQCTSDGSGVLGLGDSAHPIAIETVRHFDDALPGFVQNYAREWCSRTSSQIKACREKGGATRLGRYQDMGFCRASLKDIESAFPCVVSWLRLIVADHRKVPLVDGKNKGPNASIRQPLLLVQHLVLLTVDYGMWLVCLVVIFVCSSVVAYSISGLKVVC